MTKRPFLFLAAGLALAAPLPCRGQDKALTVDEAVASALENGPGVGAAKFNVEAALFAKKKALGSFFPKLSAEVRALYYNEAPGFKMEALTIDPATVPPPESAFDGWLLGVLAGMSSLFDSFKAEQYDVNVALTITQPITPLYQVYFGYKLSDLGVDLAKVRLTSTQTALACSVKEAYFSILKLTHGLAAMDEAIASVTAHLATAEKFYENDLITKNDVLQVKARLEEMEAQRIALEGTLAIAREGFNAAAGLEPGSEPPLAEPAAQWQGAAPSFAEAMKAALAGRPDLKEMALAVKMADAAARLAIGSFIPTVAAFGTYQYNKGSVMQYPDLAVGGVLSWDFWSWGANWYSVKELKAKKKAAEAGLAALKAAAAVEVKAALTRLATAVATVDKAQAGIDASAEQLRIEKERYAQNTGTSTDVLDAQARLTRALLDRESARYDIFIALAQLEKATGAKWK